MVSLRFTKALGSIPHRPDARRKLMKSIDDDDIDDLNVCGKTLLEERREYGKPLFVDYR